MNTYTRSFTFNQKYKKTKKLMIGLGIILAVCFVAVTIIGLIANSDNVENQNISAAIAENTQLKHTIDAQNKQIEELNAKIQSLTEQIENGTTEEEPYTPDNTDEGETVPEPSRDNPQTPRDEINN